MYSIRLDPELLEVFTILFSISSKSGGGCGGAGGGGGGGGGESLLVNQSFSVRVCDLLSIGFLLGVGLRSV